MQPALFCLTVVPCYPLTPSPAPSSAGTSKARGNPPAAAGIAAEQQLLALAAHGAVGLVAIFVIHVEELQESILAEGRWEESIRICTQLPPNPSSEMCILSALWAPPTACRELRGDHAKG